MKGLCAALFIYDDDTRRPVAPRLGVEGAAVGQFVFGERYFVALRFGPPRRRTCWLRRPARLHSFISCGWAARCCHRYWWLDLGWLIVQRTLRRLWSMAIPQQGVLMQPNSSSSFCLHLLSPSNSTLSFARKRTNPRNGTQVAQALRARLPQAAASLGGASGSSSSAVVHHNGALPATGPAFFEHCVDNQLRLHQQHSRRVAGRLVLIEFGVNTDGQPAAFERLLRKLLMLRPAVAILVVNTHVWTLKGHYRTCWKGVRASKVSMSEPEQRAEQTWEDRFNYGDEDAISRLCTHYGVPLVSMRSALLDAVRTDASPITRLSHFMIDCKHPSGQGHTYLAQLALARILGPSSGVSGGTSTAGSAGGGGGSDSTATRTGGAAVTSSSSRGRLHQFAERCSEGEATFPEGRGGVTAARLPSPMYPNGYPRGVSRCVNGESMRGLPGLSTRGFRFTGEGRGKFGWVGVSPGDWMTFCLLPKAAGSVGGGATGVTAAWGSSPTRSSRPSPPHAEASLASTASVSSSAAGGAPGSSSSQLPPGQPESCGQSGETQVRMAEFTAFNMHTHATRPHAVRCIQCALLRACVHMLHAMCVWAVRCICEGCIM